MFVVNEFGVLIIFGGIVLVGGIFNAIYHWRYLFYKYKNSVGEERDINYIDYMAGGRFKRDPELFFSGLSAFFMIMFVAATVYLLFFKVNIPFVGKPVLCFKISQQ